MQTRINLFWLCLLTVFHLGACSKYAISKPWIDGQDFWIIKDIGALARIGVITVPVTTYPIMWSGIIKDLDQIDIQNIPIEYKEVFWRVKKAGKEAFTQKTRKTLSFFHKQNQRDFNYFGGSDLDDFAVGASMQAVNKHWAWDIEVNGGAVNKPGETINNNGSYLSYVAGNWITTVGYLSHLWGGSKIRDRPISDAGIYPLNLSLKRNYANKINSEDSELPAWSVQLELGRNDKSISDKKIDYFSMGLALKAEQELDISVFFGGIEGVWLKKNYLNQNQIKKFIAAGNIEWFTPFDKWILYASYYRSDDFGSIKKEYYLGAKSHFFFGGDLWQQFFELSDGGVLSLGSAGELGKYCSLDFSLTKNSYAHNYEGFDLVEQGLATQKSIGLKADLKVKLSKQERLMFSFFHKRTVKTEDSIIVNDSGFSFLWQYDLY